jgi:hypothetical protein
MRLLAQFNTVYDALRAELGAIAIPLPPPASVASLASLKRYEDALDALVCGSHDERHSGQPTAVGQDSANFRHAGPDLTDRVPGHAE